MESEYRKKIAATFNTIEKALEGVDPDLVECEQAMGALTLIVSDGSKCILSAQPSVKQLWLALAGRGIAYHFNFDEKSQIWMDDKGKNIELIGFLESYLQEASGVRIQIRYT